MIQSANLECIKVIADPFDYLPTTYIFAGMAHSSINKQVPETRS